MPTLVVDATSSAPPLRCGSSTAHLHHSADAYISSNVAFGPQNFLLLFFFAPSWNPLNPPILRPSWEKLSCFCSVSAQSKLTEKPFFLPFQGHYSALWFGKINSSKASILTQSVTYIVIRDWHQFWRPCIIFSIWTSCPKKTIFRVQKHTSEN